MKINIIKKHINLDAKKKSKAFWRLGLEKMGNNEKIKLRLK